MHQYSIKQVELHTWYVHSCKEPIGIDVSKGKSTIAIIDDGEVIEKTFDIEHTEEGMNKLFLKLKKNKPKLLWKQQVYIMCQF